MSNVFSPQNRHHSRPDTSLKVEMLVQFSICVALLAGCYASPPGGYILLVEHDCGMLTANGSDARAYDAYVTVTSDLHVTAQLKCANDVVYTMDPINETVVDSSADLYYTGDTNGTGADCFFSQAKNGSEVYTAELEIFWGFINGSLMNEFQKYTITCTVDAHGDQEMESKLIADEFIPITDNLEDNIGAVFAETATVELVDILGHPITAKTVQMGRKVQLKVSISGGGYQGVTPYHCEAHNSDDTQSYVILNAGCGDGVIFKKTKGFQTKGLAAFSPYFKAFQLIEAMGKGAELSYSCSFTACTKKCDGSSCALKKTKTKRSANDIESTLATVQSQKYAMEELLNKRLDDWEQEISTELLKRGDRATVSSVLIVGVVGTIVVLCAIALYKCNAKDRSSTVIRQHPYYWDTNSRGQHYPTVQSVVDKSNPLNSVWRKNENPSAVNYQTEIPRHVTSCTCEATENMNLSSEPEINNNEPEDKKFSA